MPRKDKHLRYTKEDEEVQVPFKPETFEDILEHMGGFGRFQALLLLFILFYEIPSGFLAFVPVFVGGVPPLWHCEEEVGDNGSLTISHLSSSEICTCNGTRSAPAYTIVGEWNLICSKSWVVASITTIQMFGMLFGNTIPPQLSDWYGRKITFLGLMITMAGGQGLSALSPNPVVFAMARFLCGIGLAGYFSLNGIYTMEFLTPKWRQLGGCLGPLGEGLMLLGILAYFLRPWRLLLWATTFPFVTVFFVYPFLPESPRFLIRQQRYSEAAGVLVYIGRINGVTNCPSAASLEDVLKEVAEREGQVGGAPTRRYTYLDLIRIRALRGKTLIFIGIWFCWAFTYFGLSYNIRNFGVDPYLMTILMGLVDAVGFRAALLVNNRLGRRKALLAFTGISGLFFLPVGVVTLINPSSAGSYQSLFIAAILFGKLCVAGARSAVRVLTVESYPVAIRTMGFGICRVSSTFGGMLAPQIAFLGSKWPSVPLFAFGSLGFVGALLSLLLKETGGVPLEDELKEEGYQEKVQEKVKVLEKVKKKASISIISVPPPLPGWVEKEKKSKGVKKARKSKRRKLKRSKSI